MTSKPSITPFALSDKKSLHQFIELPFRLYSDDPHWVPPLKSDVKELLNPAKNPFFDHAKVQPFLAHKNGRVTGRITAHLDRLALAQPPEQGMGPGTGNWGMMEAEDAATTAALIEAAENWLRGEGMVRALGPISLSIWDEPGLLVMGQDHSPTIMMGHHQRDYQGWVEAAGYHKAKSLYTYDLDIIPSFPPLVQRIVQASHNSKRIKMRPADKSNFDEDAAIILDILNDAWGNNWGFVPITDREVAYFGKKLKPLVFGELIQICEIEGEPVAFMMTLPDLNEVIAPMNGHLLRPGLFKLLKWVVFSKPRPRAMRVPLMGVRKKLQNSRLASQLAFMMINKIRDNSVEIFGATRGEIGWILDDNQGMVAIADTIGGKINREYLIYEKNL